MTAKEGAMNIGTVIRQLRESHKMTQEDLAKAVGVSVQSVSSWELNNSTPRMGVLKKLADYFGVDVASIVAGVDQPETIATYLFRTLTPEEQQLTIDHMHFLYAQRQKANKQ